VSETMLVSGTDRVDVGQAGWYWRTHSALLQEGEVVGTAGADGGKLIPHVVEPVCLAWAKEQLCKPHVLPCVPSLIQLQEPCTGRIMSRRRATSGKCGTRRGRRG
jgi:hypothetical protein